VSKEGRTKAPTAKLKRSVIVNRLSGKKTAKLKSTSWYHEAARSIGISNKKPPERSDEAIE
jgi:hypothetical protein